MKNFRIAIIPAAILLAACAVYATEDLEEVLERGRQCYDKGMYEEAVKEFTVALQIASYESQIYYDRGRAYHALGEFDQAICDYNVAIQIDPYNAEIYHNRGNLYYYKEMLEPAIADWSSSIRLCPDCYQSYDNRAYAYYETGLYDLAWKDLKRLKNLGFRISKSFFETLSRYSEKGESIRIIKRSLRSDPDQRYSLVLPKDYNPEEKIPLLTVVDQYRAGARQQINEWKFITHSQGYILLYPDGFNWGYQEFKTQEDEKLIEMIKEASKDFAVDQDRIFLVGFNEGAEFAHRFAFLHPRQIKVACLLSGGEYELAPPRSGRAKKIIFFIGAGKGGKRYREALSFFYQLHDSGYAAEFESFSLFGQRIHSKMKYAVADFLNGLKLKR